MSKYHVVLAIARGACLDIGQRIDAIVMAHGPLDAALKAERSVDQNLGENEYSHSQKVNAVPWGRAAAMAVAA